MIKKFLVLSIILFSTNSGFSKESSKKEAAQVFKSHKEFHKATEVGMTIGKKYAVYTCQHQDGRYLAEQHKRVGTFTVLPVAFKHDFTGDKASQLYDYRRKCLCFVLRLLSDNRIWVEDFYSGQCEG